MTEHPLVSVVMPAHNAAGFISESISSIQKQTYENWELLVIDDASHDNTSQLVEEFMAGDQRIKLHSLPANQGAGFARNIGIKASKGAYISFLDADDLWLPQKLQIQLQFMEDQKVEVCYTSYELIDEKGRSKGEKIEALENLPFNKLLKANYIGNLTGIYDAERLGKIYCPLIRKRQDWGLWLLAVKKAGTAKGIKEPLAQYRLRKHSISGNKWEMLGYNFKVYREVLKLSAVKSSYRMILFLFEQLFVKSRQRMALK